MRLAQVRYSTGPGVLSEARVTIKDFAGKRNLRALRPTANIPGGATQKLANRFPTGAHPASSNTGILGVAWRCYKVRRPRSARSACGGSALGQTELSGPTTARARAA